jgi:nitrite reductase/ring-hydroxylating ferredoxin subunit
VKHELFPLGDLPPGQMRSVQVDKVAIVVARTADGELHALRDVCSHHGARLSRGRLERLVEASETGNYTLSDRYAIRCPWHGFEFDLASGRCAADAGQRVRSYPVTVENGMVVVER